MSVAVIQQSDGDKGKEQMKHLAALAILLTVAFTLVRGQISHSLYAYDEADYMFAAGLGVEHNWLDVGSMPLSEFIAVGRGRGADASQQASLSTLARSGNDPVVYRHWHGPLYYLWLAIPSAAGADEHAERALSFVFPLLTMLAMYFGSLFILGGREGQVAAILSSALFLWSPVTLETTELAPHMMFVLWYVCGLMLLAKAAAGGGRRFYYGAVVFAGLAFCTLEVAFVPILVLVIFAWWQRARLHSNWLLARNSAGLLIATILVVWPTGLLKLSFIKAYLVMLYLAVFRKGAWGDVTLAQTWAYRFAISPAEWCLFAAALALLVFTRKRAGRDGAVTFGLFAGLMILATLRVYAESPRYMTPFFPAVELFTAWMLAPAVARPARTALVYGAVGAVGCLLIWNAQHQLSGRPAQNDPHPGALLDALRANRMGEKTLLAPREAIPTLHFYFPQMRVQGYSNENELAAENSGGSFDAVLYPDYLLKVTPTGSHP